jgi:hypothetical protein
MISSLIRGRVNILLCICAWSFTTFLLWQSLNSQVEQIQNKMLYQRSVNNDIHTGVSPTYNIENTIVMYNRVCH